MNTFAPRTLSFADQSELARAGAKILMTCAFVQNMDATASCNSESRGKIQSAIRKLKEAQELIDEIQPEQ